MAQVETSDSLVGVVCVDVADEQLVSCARVYEVGRRRAGEAGDESDDEEEEDSSSEGEDEGDSDGGSEVGAGGRPRACACKITGTIGPGLRALTEFSAWRSGL